MKVILLAVAFVSCFQAFAFGPSLREADSDVERVQLEALKVLLGRQTGLDLKVSFTKRKANLLQGYNDITSGTQFLSNLVRSNEDQVLGGGAQPVVIELGPFGYHCQSMVRFKGEAASLHNLTYAGVNACFGPYLTREGEALDTKCIVSKNNSALDKQSACQLLPALLPSALSFEVRGPL